MMSPVVWSAYIDRNQLRWNDSEINLTKMVYDECEFTVDITNEGGPIQRYSIAHYPYWMKVTPSAGSINPTSTVPLTYNIPDGLHICSYTEIIYLLNENNVAYR